MATQLSEHDLDDLGRLLSDGDDTHFSAQLMRLIAKADPDNLARVRLAFPDHVEAWDLWVLFDGEPLKRCAYCDRICVKAEDGLCLNCSASHRIRRTPS